LEGLRVVDFTQFVAGPHCTLWLASLGAEVLKIESPKRPDPFRLSLLKSDVDVTLNNSPVFVATNLMKRSCCIDISTPEGQRLCHELVKVSDVVVANFRPGILDQFHMDYATLSGINPAIIVAVITGYGYTGEYAAFQALGPNVHAFSGLSAATGYRDGDPEQFFGTYGDVVAGQAAAFSILAALHDRELTGRGCFVDTSMSEALLCVAPEPVLRSELGLATAERRGNDEEGYAPHGCYPCAGGDRWIAIATFDDRDWEQLLMELDLGTEADLAGFATRAQRWSRRRDLDELIARATRSLDPWELAHRLQERSVPASVVRTAADLMTDDQMLADGFLEEVAQSELPSSLLPKMPWRISTGGELARPIGPAPDFGADTRYVLTEVLGLTCAEFAALAERGVVA
jgi:crotonobetainyl-CoA:carnitine CoA-transferase CaiB-like acyl-CoA transferase